MSTGTNNVFPTNAEPTIAGAAAGLVASGRVPIDEVAPVSKVVRATMGGLNEVALIDAVHLVDDFVGNRMPYEPKCIRTLVLSRSEPAAIGVSAIGGLMLPCGDDEDRGVVVECGPGGRPLRAPVAPGLYRTVHVQEARFVELDELVNLSGPGLLAYDGDRTNKNPRRRAASRYPATGRGSSTSRRPSCTRPKPKLFMTDAAAGGDATLI